MALVVVQSPCTGNYSYPQQQLGRAILDCPGCQSRFGMNSVGQNERNLELEAMQIDEI